MNNDDDVISCVVDRWYLVMRRGDDVKYGGVYVLWRAKKRKISRSKQWRSYHHMAK